MVSLPPRAVFTQRTYSWMVLAGVPPETASTLAKVAKPATGVKSAAGLKPGFLMTCGRMAMLWSWLRNSVWPSGAAAFSAWAAICPPAPARFSTTMLVPSSSFSLSARMRAMLSEPAPAGKPTSRRIGAPPGWALARPAAAISRPAAKLRRRSRGRVTVVVGCMGTAPCGETLIMPAARVPGGPVRQFSGKNGSSPLLTAAGSYQYHSCCAPRARAGGRCPAPVRCAAD